MLKVFNGFQLDVAADFTGLKPAQISRLRKSGIITPQKTKEGYCYSFTDLLALRVVRQLLLNDISIRDIRKAHLYLQSISPDKNLSSLQLYVRLDSKEILYIGEPPIDKTALVSLSRFGQLVHKGLVAVFPIGKQLESMRQDVLRLDHQLERGLRTKKVVPLDAVLKKYGYA